MKINRENLSALLNLLQEQGMLLEEELIFAMKLNEDHFEFAAQLDLADSIHYHIHVPDVDQLPQDLFIQKRAKVENKKDGYIKYGFPGGIKLIFSHVPVSQKEQGKKGQYKSYLDHIGIDIRSEEKQAYIVFQHSFYCSGTRLCF